MRREMRRVGAWGLLDVLAFRALSRAIHGRRDREWEEEQIHRLRSQYPADLSAVPALTVSSPNSTEARTFLQERQPDLAIARCKVLLDREIYEIPRTGTFVLHPGICPEYRNAHGCFWALANRDVSRVGMTLLRIDDGVDTGPVYLHGTCNYDERLDSHIVIQQRAVVDNLDAVGRTLTALARGEDVPPISTTGRRSAVWGQPTLSAYLRWKVAARRTAAGSPGPRSAIANPRSPIPDAPYEVQQ